MSYNSHNNMASLYVTDVTLSVMPLFSEPVLDKVWDWRTVMMIWVVYVA